MPKLLQIAIHVNVSAVGRIAGRIASAASAEGWESYVTYARRSIGGDFGMIKVGSRADTYIHALMTRLTDRHAMFSSGATRRLVSRIEELDPDVIIPHNIHGYYLDMRVLFDYLRRCGKPVIWVLHDVWPVTGHCPSFFLEDGTACIRWKEGCGHCPLRGDYPASWLADRSAANHALKRSLFTSVPGLRLVAVSDWVRSVVSESFLRDCECVRIYSGTDLGVFRPRDNGMEVRRRLGIAADAPLVFAAASVWTSRKGFDDIITLRRLLPPSTEILMAGVSDRMARRLPAGIRHLPRTDSTDELAELYSAADVFINPTYGESLSQVNVEAQACGTPVVTYSVGGSPESVSDGQTGITVPAGRVDLLAKAVEQVLAEGLSGDCREFAVSRFDAARADREYMDLIKGCQTIREKSYK